MKQSVLRVEHLSKSYGKRMVIKDVSLIARHGESVGLLDRTVRGKRLHFIASRVSYLRPAVRYF
jgi:ABC-type lipopolysaccharide export system ATPase subunit